MMCHLINKQILKLLINCCDGMKLRGEWGWMDVEKHKMVYFIPCILTLLCLITSHLL